MSSLALSREDAEQRNDEVDAEVGLEVGVRLAATDRTNNSRGQLASSNVRDINLNGGGLGGQIPARNIYVSGRKRGQQ